MKYQTKHRIKLGLAGIGIIVMAQVLIPNPFSLLAVIGGVVPLWFGTMSIVFWGAWFSGIMVGLRLIYEAGKGVKYESRYCSTCRKETQQISSGEKLRKGFKMKDPNNSIWREEYKRNIVERKYTCETCGKTNAESFTPRLLMKPCQSCGSETPHSLKSVDSEFVSIHSENVTVCTWICEQCHSETIERTP